MTDLNVIILRQSMFGTWSWWLRYPDGSGQGAAGYFKRRTDALMRAIETSNDFYKLEIKWSEALLEPEVDGISAFSAWGRD